MDCDSITTQCHYVHHSTPGKRYNSPYGCQNVCRVRSAGRCVAELGEGKQKSSALQALPVKWHGVQPDYASTGAPFCALQITEPRVLAVNGGLQAEGNQLDLVNLRGKFCCQRSPLHCRVPSPPLSFFDILATPATPARLGADAARTLPRALRIGQVVADAQDVTVRTESGNRSVKILEMVSAALPCRRG